MKKQTHDTPLARRLLCAALAALCLLLCSCKDGTPEQDTPQSGEGAGLSPESFDVGDFSAADAEAQKQEISGSFSVTSENGAVASQGERYLITKGGDYTLRGVLSEGQVYVNAPDEKVTLVLDGVSMTSAKYAAIYVADADSVTVKCEEGSYNELTDTRPLREGNMDDSGVGSGCIYADADLKLSGKGALVITGSYGHGVHTKKDLDVKNVTLKVNVPDCALRGNDSVTVESGNLILISTGADGIKTSNSDISSKGNQRGTVTIKTANIDVFSACDGIDAAYDVVIGENGSSPAINICTDTFSSYTSTVVAGSGEESGSSSSSGPSGMGGWFGGFGDFGGMSEGNTNKSDHSAKGIKAHNVLTLEGGTLLINAYDDALHAAADTALENGGVGLGNLVVNGGRVLIACADDALHADNTLRIAGGEILVTTCYEGLEGNTVCIEGGEVTVYATDDGVNANDGAATPTVLVSGGYLSVSVGSGDTDALDTNGIFEQTGGVVVVRGGSTGMATALDIARSCSVSGGTLVVAGSAERMPTIADSCCMVVFGSFTGGMGMGPGGMGSGMQPGGMGGNRPGDMGGMGGFGGPGGNRPGGRSGGMEQGTEPKTDSTTSATSGTLYTVEGTTISFMLDSMQSLWIISDQIKLGGQYTLTDGQNAISWTQSSVQTQVQG
ncbi:MAG: carbohydrate-binding domain-containing protein [Clostridia bacterium]|nr:carbohydrate-binding domain-containing protein [Clostridia bacterium]